MLILKLGEVVDVLVDYNVEVVGLVMGGHIREGECFGHGGWTGSEVTLAFAKSRSTVR